MGLFTNSDINISYAMSIALLGLGVTIGYIILRLNKSGKKNSPEYRARPRYTDIEEELSREIELQRDRKKEADKESSVRVESSDH